MQRKCIVLCLSRVRIEFKFYPDENCHRINLHRPYVAIATTKLFSLYQIELCSNFLQNFGTLKNEQFRYDFVIFVSMVNMHNLFRILRHFQPKRLSVRPVSYFSTSVHLIHGRVPFLHCCVYSPVVKEIRHY